MAEIINLHPDQVISVKLTGAEWLAIMLALAGRTADLETRNAAEAKMFQQLLKGEG